MKLFYYVNYYVYNCKMKRLIEYLDLRHYFVQFKFGRKLFKGKYYLIRCMQLSMVNFWSNEEITSCQSITVKTEEY